jgi:hypothetical protein
MISGLIRDGALHWSVANLFQGGKFLRRKPHSATGKAWFWFQSIAIYSNDYCLATIGWHGRVKAAGAFDGLPRELRENILAI